MDHVLATHVIAKQQTNQPTPVIVTIAVLVTALPAIATKANAIVVQPLVVNVSVKKEA